MAYAIADFVWNNPNVSLMCGLAMTATAMSLTMVSQQSPGLQHLSLQTYITFDMGRYATLAILLAALLVGLLAHYFGFHPILNREAFFALMITAFFLNILVPVTITWWRPWQRLIQPFREP